MTEILVVPMAAHQALLDVRSGRQQKMPDFVRHYDAEQLHVVSGRIVGQLKQSVVDHKGDVADAFGCLMRYRSVPDYRVRNRASCGHVWCENDDGQRSVSTGGPQRVPNARLQRAEPVGANADLLIEAPDDRDGARERRPGYMRVVVDLNRDGWLSVLAIGG